MATLLLASVASAEIPQVVEVDLVFPRNETYTPTPYFPVVFGIQNAELAQHLRLQIDVSLWNDSDTFSSSSKLYTEDLIAANFSSAEPYFAYSFTYNRFEVEGRWRIHWNLYYSSCLEDEDGIHRGKTKSNASDAQITYFTIKNDGRPIDLVAITADDKTCPPEQGTIIEVTTETVKVAELVPTPFQPNFETCAVVATTNPTPTPNPCLVKVDAAAAASIATSLWLHRCNNVNMTDDPTDCPPDSLSGRRNNAAQQLAAVSVVVVLTAAMGAFGFLSL
jgi:hypothetical protein